MSNIPHSEKIFDCLEVINFSNKNAKLYCVWFSNEESDGFFLSDSALRIFPSECAAFEFLTAFPSYGKEIKTTTYDIDVIKQIICRTEPFSAHTILDFWNIIGDLASSIKVPYEGNTKDSLTNSVYDKLFYGNNLPEINTSDCVYVPQFTSEEYARLITILLNGIAIVEGIVGSSGSVGLTKGDAQKP